MEPIVQYSERLNKEDPGILETIMEEVLKMSHFHLSEPSEVAQTKWLTRFSTNNNFQLPTNLEDVQDWSSNSGEQNQRKPNHVNLVKEQEVEEVIMELNKLLCDRGNVKLKSTSEEHLSHHLTQK